MALSRRTFLSSFGLAAPAVLVAPREVQSEPQHLRLMKVSEHHWADLSQGVKKPGGLTISSEPGMRGESEWAKHCDAGGQWRVYLNGEDQYWFSAASEEEGWVLRDVSVPDPNGIPVGNGRREVPVLNGVSNEWVQEVVYGDVVIRAIAPVDCGVAV